MSALDDFISGKQTTAPVAPTAAVSPSPQTVTPSAPTSAPATSASVAGPLMPGETALKASAPPTQNAPHNLLSVDPKTGNKTFKLPDFAGGGVYTEDANGNLVNQGHSNYGGEPAVAGQERDDIIPVSLGGTNSNSQNIRDVPMSIAGPQDIQEKAMAKQVKAGQIDPHAAITQILSEKAKTAGVDPTDSKFQNFISSLPKAITDTLYGAFVQPEQKILADAGTRIAQTGISAAEPLMSPGLRQTVETNLQKPQNELGVTVEPQKQGVQGAEQIGGQALNAAAAIGNVAMAGGLASGAKNVVTASKNILETNPASAEGGYVKFNAKTSQLEDTISKLQDKRDSLLSEDNPNKTLLKQNSEALKSAQVEYSKQVKQGGFVGNAKAETKPQSLKDVTPDYNKNMEGEKVTNSEGKSQYRVNPAKNFGSKTVNPSVSETAAAQEVDKLGKMPTKGGFTAKSQFVDQGITNEAEGMRTNLQAEDKAIPLDTEAEKTKIASLVKSNLPKDIQSKMGFISAEDEANLSPTGKAYREALLKAEPPQMPKTVAGRYYQKVLDEVQNYDGTREGKLDLRQNIDTAYKNARGKLAFGDEKLNELDETNKDIRDNLNKDLSASTKNTDTQASLKKQTNLYRAKDILDTKAQKEGSTYFGRHPTQAMLGRRLGMTAAVSGGIALATGSSLSSGAGKLNKAVGGEFNKLRGYTPPPKATKPKALPKPKAPKKIKL